MTNESHVRVPELGARTFFSTASAGNLARHVGDDPRTVDANRASLEAQVGSSILYVNQTHSADVITLGSPADVDRVRAHAPDADALVTSLPDVALAIMVADCVPVLLADPESGVVGAAHAGRRGLLGGILGATVSAMEALGAFPSRIRAAIGPSICGRCYEVPDSMRDEAVRINPAVSSQTSWGTPGLDLQAGVRWALGQAGIEPNSVRDLGVCTLETPDFFSYRRSTSTGRFVGVIALESPVA